MAIRTSPGIDPTNRRWPSFFLFSGAVFTTGFAFRMPLIERGLALPLRRGRMPLPR